MGLMYVANDQRDVFAANWMLGKPAVFNFTVTSQLVSNNLSEASVLAG